MKLDLSQFDGVAWDFDGTLTDAYHIHEASRYEVFSKNGLGHISMAEHKLGHTYGPTTSLIIGGILKAAGELSSDADVENDPLVQELVSQKRELYASAAHHGLDAQPGAVNFVQELGKCFVDKMAITTTAQQREVTPFLQRYNLGPLFPIDKLITEETVNDAGLKLKPAPDAYLLTAKILGISTMARLLVIEDSIGGIEAAVRSGATTLAVGTTHSREDVFDPELDYHPHIYVSSFLDIELV